jgi:hypothetical protein
MSSTRNANTRSNIRGPSTVNDVFSSFSQDFASISNSLNTLPVPGRVDVVKSFFKEASSLAQKNILDFVDADRLRKEEEERQKSGNSISSNNASSIGSNGLHTMNETATVNVRMDANDYRNTIPPKQLPRSAADDAESLLLADLKAAGIEYSRNDQSNASGSLSSASISSSQLPNSSSTGSGASLQNVQESVFRTAEDLISKASDQFNNAAANLPAVRDEFLSQWQRRMFSSLGAGGVVSLSSTAGGSGGGGGNTNQSGILGQDSDDIKVKKLSILSSTLPVSSSTLSTRPLTGGMLNPASISTSSSNSTSTLFNSCTFCSRAVFFIIEIALVVIRFVGRTFINISMRLVGRTSSSDVSLSSSVESIAGLTMFGLVALLYYYFAFSFYTPTPTS